METFSFFQQLLWLCGNICSDCSSLNTNSLNGANQWGTTHLLLCCGLLLENFEFQRNNNKNEKLKEEKNLDREQLELVIEINVKKMRPQKDALLLKCSHKTRAVVTMTTDNISYGFDFMEALSVILSEHF